MTITIAAFEQSPDGGKGLARDTRVRWVRKKWANPTRFALFRSVR
jgi:glutathione S-transferase